MFFMVLQGNPNPRATATSVLRQAPTAMIAPVVARLWCVGVKVGPASFFLYIKKITGRCRLGVRVVQGQW